MLDMRTLLRGTAAAAGAFMIVLAAAPSAADILDDYCEVLNSSLPYTACPYRGLP